MSHTPVVLMKALLTLCLLCALACGREELFEEDAPSAEISSAPTQVEAPAPPAKAGPITDTHIHLWDLPRSEPPMSDNGSFPGASPAWLATDALLPNYDATLAGGWVDHVVVIEALSGVPDARIVAANQWLLAQAKAEPKIFGVVGGLSVTQDPAAFLAQLEPLASDPQFLGLRITGGALFRNGRLRPNVASNLAEVATRGLLVETLDTNGSQVAELARAIGELTIVMDHLGQKSYDFQVPSEWLEQLTAASREPRVFLKISDTGRLNQGEREDSFSQPYPSSEDSTRYHAVFEAIFGLFGEDRLMFGSNWPVSNVAGDFRTQILVLEAFLATKGPTARNKVMSENAVKVYGARRSAR